MVEAIATKNAETTASPVDKLYMENTLLRVAGALFCHDQKRAAKRTDEIELNRCVQDKHIRIRPNPRYGQPGPLAHRIFVAIIKKHSDYGRPVQNEVSFTQRELGRLIGRKDFGGKDSAQIIRALSEIQTTFIETGFFNEARKLWIEHTFNIFPEITIARRSEHSTAIEECSVMLARPIVESLKDDHFTCLNHFLMQRLGSIGQALYMRLFFHFANLYDGHHTKRLKFEKRYADICNEWLGGLTILQHKSKILAEQLGPHLTQLEQVGFLASYAIRAAGDGNGLVISFRPGAAFFADYDRFYRHRQQGELQWNFHADRQTISEPLKVARLFQEKRGGEAAAPVAFVSRKDMDTAREVLERVAFEEVPAFFDYALAEAKSTNFDVQTLGGLKQYLGAYIAARGRIATAKAAAVAHKTKDQDDADRVAYERFRRAQAEGVFKTLPAEEQAAIEALARGSASSAFGGAAGSIATTLVELARCRLTAQRHPTQITPFQEWQSSPRRVSQGKF